MSYKVRFSDFSKSLTVEDQVLNTETSVSLVGKQYLNYAPVISENFLHLLENFAFNQPPNNPIQGQLWYDTSLGINLLKVYNGIRWVEIGSIKKSPITPGDPILGDLWVDTINNQLKMYTNSSDPSTEWITIGPSLGSTDTGIVVENIIDINAQKHSVICVYVNTNRMAIFSSDEPFIPQAVIPGFEEIKLGINLNNLMANIYGTASSSNALIINNTAIAADRFLRDNVVNKLVEPINVQHNSGISIGNDLKFNLGINSENNIVILSRGNDKSINIGYESLAKPVISIQASNGIGVVEIGSGLNTIPSSITLDIAGNTRINGELTVKSISATGKISSNSILPPVSETPSENANGFDIGFEEESPGFLTGVWVGISTVHSTPLKLENIIMIINENNEVGITGWISQLTGLVKFNPPVDNLGVYSLNTTGKLTRIRNFVYFYSEISNLAYRTGCALQSIIVNKFGDIATIGFLTKKNCPDDVSFELKTATVYKMSDDIDDFSSIYDDINTVNDQWVQ